MHVLKSVRRAVAVCARDATVTPESAMHQLTAALLFVFTHSLSPNQTVGAIMFIDESSGGMRAVLAGTAPVVAAARELVQAHMIEQATWSAPAHPHVIIPPAMWVPPSQGGWWPQDVGCDGHGMMGSASPLPASPPPQQDDDWVHWTHQVPLTLVGLLIGVGGATIREMEADTRCHLSLDRSKVHTDGAVPYLFLHIHGSQQGASKAVGRCTDLLQRHVDTLQMKSWAQLQQTAAAPAEPEQLSAQAAAWGARGCPSPCALPWEAACSPDGSHQMSPGTPAVDGMAGVSKLELRSRWLREHHTSGSDEEESMQ
jgi:hypothetical protein